MIGYRMPVIGAEFHDRLEEDPKDFINGSVALLKQTNLLEVYIYSLSQQLKDHTATWWKNLRALSLEWKAFEKGNYYTFTWRE